jgi:hypothetical protein
MAYCSQWIPQVVKWSTTVPPMKVTLNESECHRSHWCESLCKDVECTFGILKGHWRILKTGIRLQGMETANNIWLTCCAFHNWLLEVDGLDGEWEGERGQLEPGDVVRHVPFAVQWLSLGFDPREYDESGYGPADDRLGMVLEMPTDNGTDHSCVIEDTQNDSSHKNVRHLGLPYFRNKVIEHFVIMFKHHELVWPIHRPCNDI